MTLQQKTFFFTTIPGLEPVTHLELCDKWGRAAAFFDVLPYPDIRSVRGGCEFEAPTALGLLLTRLVRSNTRVLMREKSFEAKDEKQFIAGLKSIDWQPYFASGSGFDFKFTSKSSRISMSKQVRQCLQDVLKKHKVKYQKEATTIYVRLFRDQCNISIDCSGEAHFRRGEKSKGSIASLRESTASGLLRLLFQGMQGPFDLIDPMCGSGTFLKEAMNLYEPLRREFQFEHFPMHQEVRASMESALATLNTDGPRPTGGFGYDDNPKAVALAKKNLADLNIQVDAADLFQGSQGLPQPSDRKRVVVLNPPWGRRLPGASQDVLKAVFEKYQPHRIGLLMPARWKINAIPLEKTRDVAILNSGVENRFLIFA